MRCFFVCLLCFISMKKKTNRIIRRIISNSSSTLSSISIQTIVEVQKEKSSKTTWQNSRNNDVKSILIDKPVNIIKQNNKTYFGKSKKK